MGQLRQIDPGRIEVAGIRQDAYGGTGRARADVADALQRFNRRAAGKGDAVDAAAPLDFDFQTGGQGIGNGHAHTMQATGKTIGVAAFRLVELAARVQLAEHQFDRWTTFFRMNFDRNTTAVIGHFDPAIGGKPDADFPGKTGQRFVGCVVDDLLHDVGRAGGTGVHPGAFLDRFEVLENTDGGCGVIAHAEAGVEKPADFSLCPPHLSVYYARRAIRAFLSRR